ncbi:MULTISPECIES: adenylyl-sulfate kinase [unclassified Solwaraspora]|uniref:adenylyl-sulfate kinase n=1 Tax=unclassified Solwaraspora TaxID=2627926 RepID=UPI00259AED88|nr:adenylyl-sulfate kinase [Solwaraspora sp. WMMA2056]WJK39972.1 dephospho-CoA kinase [Solwaraspora sp. WMMA2056]
MAHLVILTGPIAAGKNTVAELLADLLTDAGRTVVVVDVDEVAAMVRRPGAGAGGLWFAAHEAHGARAVARSGVSPPGAPPVP